MSIKTLRKRIALVAVSALGVGLLSVAPASAGAGTMTLKSVNGPVIVKEAATGEDRTITIASSASIRIAFTAGTNLLGKVTVENGTITSTSQLSDLADGTSTSTSFVYGNLTDAEVTFLPDTGVGVMLIKSYADGSTLTGTYTVTVRAASSIGVVSAANSLARIADSASDTGIANSVDSTTGGTSLEPGNNGRINFSLKDGNDVAMPATTVTTATATGGCLVNATADATANYLSASTSATGATGSIWVARSVTNAPFTCTISLSVNGTAWLTKTMTLKGKATKIEVVGGQGGISNAYATSSDLGNGAGVSAEAFAYNIYDAAGNALWVAPTSVTSVSTTAFTSAQSTNAPTLARGYGLGSITCSGLARGSGTFQINYTNNASESIKSPVYTANCFGTAYTYAASLDKASYAPGEIATLTITAKDKSGNPANDYVYLGGAVATGYGTSNPVSIAGSNMTAVTAPTSTDMFSGGKKTYKFVVGSTEGTYQMVVDLPKFNDSTIPQASVTVPYAIKAPSTGAVSNAEVLAAIVKLIASINKQIRALQKSLRR